MGLGDLIKSVVDTITGQGKDDPTQDVRPASEDPYGDPADQLSGQDVLPASQDPYGDPADEMAGQDVLPASQDPYGDPADADPTQIQGAAQQHLSNTDPSDTIANVARQVSGMAPGQASGMAGQLLNLAQQQGVDVNALLGRLGISPNDAAAYLPQIMGMLHQEHPNELAQATAQQPGLAGLLAHPSVGGVLGALASRFMGGH